MEHEIFVHPTKTKEGRTSNPITKLSYRYHKKINVSAQRTSRPSSAIIRPNPADRKY
jgi:hypothetical protein